MALVRPLKIDDAEGIARELVAGDTINPAVLGTGTPSSSTVLDGAGAWRTIASVLGFTPYDAANPAGYLSAITAGMVTAALGYTPADAAHLHSGIYEPVIAAGTAAQYWRGDKSWQTLDKAAVGLGNVTNNAQWHAGNDGAGSGLDADQLDGQEGSFYRDASNLNAGTVPAARLGSGSPTAAKFLRGDGAWASTLDGIAFAVQPSSGSDAYVRAVPFAGSSYFEGYSAVATYVHAVGSDTTGAHLILRPSDNSGFFAVVAQNGIDACGLDGSPYGPLFWNSVQIAGATGLIASALAAGTIPDARMPALTGDVTSAVNTVATTIAPRAVTFAKVQAIATASVLGRSTAGSGDIEVLTTLPAVSGANLTNLNASSLASGTVPSARIDWASPGAIGSTTPNTGAFTTMAVGLGAGVAPSRALHVADTLAGIGVIAQIWNQTAVAANVGAAMNFQGGVAGNGLAALEAAFAGAATTDGAYFAIRTRAPTSGVLTERMRVDANGNVGIGLTPSYLLHMAASSTFAMGTPGSSGGFAVIGGPGSPTSVRQTFGGDGTGWQMRWAKNVAGTVTDLMYLTDGGALGVGEVPSGYKFVVAGGAIKFDNAQPIYFENASGTPNPVLQVYSDNNVYLDGYHGSVLIRGGAAGSLSGSVTVGSGGTLTATGLIAGGSTTLIKSNVALNNGAGAASGTLTNAPAAGNPTKWVPINDNGTTRYIPAW